MRFGLTSLANRHEAIDDVGVRIEAALLSGLAVLTACSSGPSAPKVTALDYSPMQLAVSVTATISGTARFADADGDVTQIVLGLVDPQGILTEGSPKDTASPGVLTGSVVFGLTVTPTQTGTHSLSVRFVDGTGLSSAATLEPIDVR